MQPTELTLLNESLKRLISSELAREGETSEHYDISFARPGKDVFSPTRPTINIYLYDIAENLQLREQAWDAATSDGVVTARRRSPARVDLSYRVSCWSQEWEDEQDLLWMVLRILYRNLPLPLDRVDRSLARSQSRPVQLKVANPGANLNTLTEFWSSLGGVLRPSFQLVATLEMPLELEATVGPPVRTRQNRYKIADGEEGRRPRAKKGGTPAPSRINGAAVPPLQALGEHHHGPRVIAGSISVERAGGISPVPHARIEVLDANGQGIIATTRSDRHGRFRISHRLFGAQELGVRATVLLGGRELVETARLRADDVAGPLSVVLKVPETEVS